jgi:conjugative transposon TraM protein
LTPGPTLEGLKYDPAPGDAQAAELKRKLQLLQDMISRQQEGAMSQGPLGGKVPDRVSNLGAGLPERPYMPFDPGGARIGQGDPDLDKLNVLMDKVLKVRYPGDAPIRDTSLALPEARPAQSLSAPVQEEVMTTLPVEDKGDLETGFIELDAGGRGDSLAETMIAAVVDGSQTLKSGEAVAFRTAADAMLGGTRVPKGTALAGKAVLSGERLKVTVNSLRIDSRVIPVALEVVDMDGMTGIRVKGSINRDASKESADQAVGSLGIMSADASVAGQATAAGLQAAKSLLSRKIRLVRVGLPSGYKILLRNVKR